MEEARGEEGGGGVVVVWEGQLWRSDKSAKLVPEVKIEIEAAYQFPEARAIRIRVLWIALTAVIRILRSSVLSSSDSIRDREVRVRRISEVLVLVFLLLGLI